MFFLFDYTAIAANSMCLQADEAYRLGPPLASQSYLRGDVILDIAKHCGAQVTMLAYPNVLLSAYSHTPVGSSGNDVSE